MRISAVLTTYNRCDLLLQAIASIRAQTRPPDEILVIDDGSTDQTPERLAQESVRYIWQANAGTSAARNAGWQLATGDWIAYLDSDDLWLPRKLALQECAAEEDVSAEGIFGHAENFADEAHSPLFDPDRHRLNRSTPCWLPGAALVRRSLLVDLGGFNPRFKTAEVVEWNLHMRRRRTPTIMLPELVLRRRLHAGNKQLASALGRSENFALLREWQQRRRGDVAEARA